jgi:hypothetical protein
MTDPTVHDGALSVFTMTDPTVHDGAIWVFTLERCGQRARRRCPLG